MSDLNELARRAASTEVERLRAGERAGRALDEADVAAVAAQEANKALDDAVQDGEGRGTAPAYRG